MAAALPNDTESIADKLGNGLPSSGDEIVLSEGDEVKEEAKAEPTKSADDERWAKFKERQRKLELENQFWRGKLAAQERGATEPKAPAQPAEVPELKLDFAKLKQDLAGENAEQVLVDLIKQITDNATARTEQKLNANVTTTLQQRDAVARRNQAFTTEINQIVSDVGDLWNNDEFKAAADAQALKNLSLRLGRDANEIDFSNPNNLYLFQPGDLNAAVQTIYAQWIRSGKIKDGATKPLREVIRNASSEVGGVRRAGGPKAPSSIDDLDLSDAEKRDAKAVARSLGVSESEWVKNYLEGV